MDQNIKESAHKAAKIVKKTVITVNVIISVIFLAFVAALIIVSLIRDAHGEVIVIGRYGKTYPFEEKNFLTVIKNKIKHKNWAAYRKSQHFKKKIEDYQPYSQEVLLPTALHTKTFKPDMYYTLKFNIRDSKGNIIYPKGFRYKITDYITLPNVLVVINGESKTQLNWFVHSPYYNNIGVMFMITHGNYFKLDKKLKIPTYYYMSSLQKRFQLKAVPSIIWQKGHNLFVKQIGKYEIQKDLKKWNRRRTKQKVSNILKESGLLNKNYR